MSTKLGQFLVDRGVLREDQVAVALREQASRYRLFGQVCVDLKFIEDRILLQHLSDFHDLPYVFLQEMLLKREIVCQLPKSLAVGCQAILMDQCEGRYTMAMVDPTDLRLVDHLEKFIKPDQPLLFHLACEREIANAINLYYPRPLETPSMESKAVGLIQEILEDAASKKVSDVHFRPENVTLTVWYRHDGILKKVRTLHKEIWESLSVRLKILSKMDIAETRRAQSGSFELNEWGRRFDCRVSFHPTIYGENVVVRLLDQQKTMKSLPELGFSPEQQNLLKQLMEMPDGLIFISGPTGAGKTTTLYALLQLMDTQTRHVMTLEDPVEYHFSHVRQTQIISGVMEFADGIRSLLRQDPDIIFISEIRDSVTAEMAVRAALTGHLVLATIHARDNFLVLHRLKELGVFPETLTGLMRGLINQRLVRRCCSLCGAQGCLACDHSGFQGRLAVAEILPMDYDFQQLLALGGNWSDLMLWREQRGHMSLGQWAHKLVEQGMTTTHEVQRIYRE